MNTSAIAERIAKRVVGGGWGRFSEELADSLSGIVLKNKRKNPREIIRIIRRDEPLVKLMNEEGMEDEDLLEYIDETISMFGHLVSRRKAAVDDTSGNRQALRGWRSIIRRATESVVAEIEGLIDAQGGAPDGIKYQAGRLEGAAEAAAKEMNNLAKLAHQMGTE